jgi:hypothetical protein
VNQRGGMDASMVAMLSVLALLASLVATVVILDDRKRSQWDPHDKLWVGGELPMRVIYTHNGVRDTLNVERVE